MRGVLDLSVFKQEKLDVVMPNKYVIKMLKAYTAVGYRFNGFRLLENGKKSFHR